jgi:cell division protein FtsB
MPRAAERSSRRPPPTTLLRRWSAVVVALIVGYFYYHPIQTYFATKHDLGATRAEVRQLRDEKSELTRRLATASSTQALARAARELGYVRPGEHLFIVKGIEAWKRRHTLRDGGN